MKDLKGSTRDSIFPVKLFIIYVLLLTFVTGMVDGPLDFIFGLGFPHPEDAFESFAEMLALSPALLIVIFLVIWYFRRMPIFAWPTSLMALWLIWVIWDSYSPGFDTDFPNDLNTLGFIEAPFKLAIPFVVIYLVWYFWPRKQAGGLPVN